MRADMSKVIVERPRWGSRMWTARRVRRLDPKHVVVDEDAVDPFPSRIGHRAGAKQSRRFKSLNENLAPLRRYLERQVGRRWDDVWSEISAHLRPTSTVQQHVRDHVDDFVAVRTFMRDGVVLFDTWSGPRTLDDPRHGWVRLYVDPVSGVLCRNGSRRSWREEKRKANAIREAAFAARGRRLGPKHLLLLLDDGNWWEVRLGNCTCGQRVRLPSGQWVLRAPPVVDVIDQAGLSQLPRDERYGAPGLHALAKRPLSKRDIRRHGLRGAAG